MRALVQRVSKAGVSWPGGEPRAIGKGLLIYLGIGKEDQPAAADKLAQKCLALRIFPNPEGKFDRSVQDEKGDILVISQFTLYGDVSGGRRPDFTAAAPPNLAVPLYERFIRNLRQAGVEVKTGEFGALMAVESVNDGPVNLWLDTDRF